MSPSGILTHYLNWTPFHIMKRDHFLYRTRNNFCTIRTSQILYTGIRNMSRYIYPPRTGNITVIFSIEPKPDAP